MLSRPYRALLVLLIAIIMMTPIAYAEETQVQHANQSLRRDPPPSGCFSFVDTTKWRLGGYGTEWQVGVLWNWCPERAREVRIESVIYKLRTANALEWSGTAFQSYGEGRFLTIDNLPSKYIEKTPGDRSFSFTIENKNIQPFKMRRKGFWVLDMHIETVGLGPLPNNIYDFRKRIKPH